MDEHIDDLQMYSVDWEDAQDLTFMNHLFVNNPSKSMKPRLENEKEDGVCSLLSEPAHEATLRTIKPGRGNEKEDGISSSSSESVHMRNVGESEGKESEKAKLMPSV